MFCATHKNIMVFLSLITLTFCSSVRRMSYRLPYTLDTSSYFFMDRFRLNISWEDLYKWCSFFQVHRIRRHMIDYPVLVMLLLVFWLRWCTYLYSVVHITQRLCSHSEKQSIRPHSRVHRRRQSLCQALRKTVPPQPSCRPPASPFHENHLSEPETPCSNAPTYFSISVGAPAQRISTDLFCRARPRFATLLGLGCPRAFSLKGSILGP